LIGLILGILRIKGEKKAILLIKTYPQHMRFFFKSNFRLLLFSGIVGYLFFEKGDFYPMYWN